MRVLVIAYYFPPVGGAGVQRSLKFVRYLPEFGVTPVVVTGPFDSIGDQSLTDDTLERQLPDELTVLRVPGPEPRPSSRNRRRAERWLRLERPWLRWWIDGVLEAARDAGPVDLVFATMSPFESADAASTLSRELGVPWVADLRDPWALDEMFVYPTGIHRALERRHMRRLLSTAAAVVMNTPESAAALRRELIPGTPPSVHSITNGFDSGDFDGEVPPRSDDRFRIVHTGELHTELGLDHRRRGRLRRLLGGQLHGVDILPRSHVYLLEAMERLRQVDPALGARVELHLAGKLTEADLQAIGSSDATVHDLGYLDHPRTISLLRSADLLFLPMHDLDSGARSRIVPGKTYEYLAAARPILAAVPPGDARDFVMAAGGSFVVGPTAVDEMVSAICVAAAASPGTLGTLRDPEVVAAFERRALTAQLAEVFMSVAASKETPERLVLAG